MASVHASRIIFLPFIDAFGGEERLVLDLSRFLHERAVPHQIACFRASIDLQSYADWPLNIHQIESSRNSLIEARALNQFLELGRVNGSGRPLLVGLKSAFYSGIASANSFVLHLTDPPSLLPADVSKYAPAARRRLSRFNDLPQVGVLRERRAAIVHWLNGRGVRRASKVIVMTDKIQNEIRDLYRAESLVIRPGVSPKKIRPRAASDNSKTPLRLLSVSRLEPSKRVDWILNALAALNSERRADEVEWEFEIVGEGSEFEPLKKLANDLGLASRTRFRGHISDSELELAFGAASLFLMPAVQGYGLPALEALGRGIPTIVHKESGVSEILGGSPWAEIVDGNNGSLTSAISVMLDRLKRNSLLDVEIPRVPTSSDWAEAICSECGWLAA